jgi:acyl-CoA thioesterase-1
MLRASRWRKSWRYGPDSAAFNKQLALLCGWLLAACIWVAPAAAADSQVRTIVAFGDSLIAGYGLPPQESFPARLEQALRAAGRQVRVVNAGVSGDTSAAGLARLDWSVADKPDLMLVNLGSNDMLRGLDPVAAERNLDALLARLQQRQIPVLLTGMFAGRNLGEAYVRQFESMYPRLAEKYGATLYPFFLDGVATDPALNQADGLHPNAAGVNVIVGKMLPTVLKALDRNG